MAPALLGLRASSDPAYIQNRLVLETQIVIKKNSDTINCITVSLGIYVICIYMLFILRKG